MRNNRYTTILLGLIVTLWLVYILFHSNSPQEGFLGMMGPMYRPYVRQIRHLYESWHIYPSVVHKLRKWNIV